MRAILTGHCVVAPGQTDFVAATELDISQGDVTVFSGRAPTPLATAPLCIVKFPDDPTPTILVSWYDGRSLELGAIEAFHPDGPRARWGSTSKQTVGWWSLTVVGRQLLIRTGFPVYLDGPQVSAAATVDLLDFRGSKFVDVTRRFPKTVGADAAMWWKLFRKTHGENELAAWVADECALGKRTSAFATVGRIGDRHQLRPYPGFQPPAWDTYLTEVEAVCSASSSRGV